MTRYKLTIQYDGTRYSGFQVQPDERTIQSEVEKAISVMLKGEAVRIFASGRTDAGVHALGQVIHFDFPKQLTDGAMMRSLNTILPDDIVVSAEEVVPDDFHARYDAKSKTYDYYIYNDKIRNPFIRHQALWHPYPLDNDKMKIAISAIIGEHDFTSYASSKDDKKSKVRTIYDARCTYDKNRNMHKLSFTANGFLYNQVRVLVGTLLEIGDGRRLVSDMEDILLAKDRQKAGSTAAAHGLYLNQVNY